MPTIFVDGREIQAEKGQTVMEVMLAHGVIIRSLASYGMPDSLRVSRPT